MGSKQRFPIFLTKYYQETLDIIYIKHVQEDSERWREEGRLTKDLGM